MSVFGHLQKTKRLNDCECQSQIGKRQLRTIATTHDTRVEAKQKTSEIA